MTRSLGQKLADAIHVAIVNFMSFTGTVRVETVESRPWASVTFSGARHRVLITFEGAGAVGAAADLLARLEDLEIVLPGQILADLALCAEMRSDDGLRAALDLEALTIEE